MAAPAQQLRGLALPAIREAGGYFVSKNPDQVAWGALITAVFTPIGSRPMRRQFGSVLHEVVNEPADNVSLAAVELAVREAAKTYAPHVTILRVMTQVDGRNIGVLIEYSRSDDKSRTLRSPLVRVSQSDVTNYLASRRNT
jgi:phage baseplate assembly protein W